MDQKLDTIVACDTYRMLGIHNRYDLAVEGADNGLCGRLDAYAVAQCAGSECAIRNLRIVYHLTIDRRYDLYLCALGSGDDRCKLIQLCFLCFSLGSRCLGGIRNILLNLYGALIHWSCLVFFILVCNKRQCKCNAECYSQHDRILHRIIDDQVARDTGYAVCLCAEMHPGADHSTDGTTDGSADQRLRVTQVHTEDCRLSDTQ